MKALVIFASALTGPVIVSTVWGTVLGPLGVLEAFAELQQAFAMLNQLQ